LQVIQHEKIIIVDDDTYFVPYQDDFMIGIDKKVTVEVLSKSNSTPLLSETKKKVIVEVVSSKDKIVTEIFNKFKLKNISIHNLKGNKNVPVIISEVILKYNVNHQDLPQIQEQLFMKLKADL